LLRPFTTKYNDESNLTSYKLILSAKSLEYSANPSNIPTKEKWNYTNNISCYRLPPVSGEGNCPVTCTTLNPFLESGYSRLGWILGNSAGHDIEYVVRDGVYPTDLCIRHPQDNYSTDNWYRAVALKGPLVIAGWGYDIYGKPVPNSGSNTAYFKDNWLRRPQDWKCGPVDLRWDENRGVWTFPQQQQIIRAKVLTTNGVSGTECEIYYDPSDPFCFHQKQYDCDGVEINKRFIIPRNMHAVPLVSGMYIVAKHNFSSYYLSSIGYTNHSMYEVLWAETPSFTVTPYDITRNNNTWTTNTCKIETATGYGSINGQVGQIYPCTDIPPISGYTIQAEFYQEAGVIKLRQKQPYVQILESALVDSMNTKVTMTRTSEEIDWSSSSSIWKWTINNIPDGTHIAVGYSYSSKSWFACGAECYPSPVCGII
jgi:hypothetical protein